MRGTRNPCSVWIDRDGQTYRVRWVDPKTHKRRSRGTRDRALAREWQVQKLNELRRREAGQPDPMTIDQAADQIDTWMAGLAKPTRQMTIRTLRRLAKIVGPMPLASVDRGTLLTFRARQLEAGFAVASVNKELRLISAAISYAVDAGVALSNPALQWGRRQLEEPQRRLRIVEPAEFAALLAAARSAELLPRDQMAGVLILGYYQGLRRTEVCRLRWDAVDLDRRVCWVENIYDADAPGPELTKSKRVRTVPLRAAAVKWLRQHWTKTRKRLEAGRAVAASPHVFTWPDGRPVCPDWLSHRIPKLVNAAGLNPPATFHDLRRSFSTLAQRAGVDRETVKDLGGWSSTSVVKNHYTGQVDDHLRDVVDRLDRRIPKHA